MEYIDGIKVFFVLDCGLCSGGFHLGGKVLNSIVDYLISCLSEAAAAATCSGRSVEKKGKISDYSTFPQKKFRRVLPPAAAIITTA